MGKVLELPVKADQLQTFERKKLIQRVERLLERIKEGKVASCSYVYLDHDTQDITISYSGDMTHDEAIRINKGLGNLLCVINSYMKDTEGNSP